jgi:energy-coupling factor transporter ATP-binding protein EcfA2
VAGIFDVALEKRSSERFTVDLPAEDEDWRIGLIVGPSGSGKSTIARHAYGDRIYSGGDWPADHSVLDGFGEERSIKEITHLLAAVGFSSPPNWVKPYAVLSNGEKFRCDLARALLSENDLVVYDEFTSVVDRTVAKIGSAAVSRAIRKGRVQRKFVAVTCHYDVADWLEPDWVLDMASRRLARRRLRRPEIRLEVAPVHRSAWVLFRRHHYLSTSLMVGARCFVAFWGDEPVAFSAWVNRMTKKRQPGDMREHRTVVLPDFQGLGIGNRLSEFCASIWRGMGGRAFSTTSHPAMIRYRSASPQWKRQRLGMVNKTGSSGIYAQSLRRAGKLQKLHSLTACERITAGFQYVGPAMSRDETERFAKARPLPFSPSGRVVSVEAIVARYPGATTSLVARLTGLSPSAARTALDELVETGELARAGPGGAAGRQYAFYPAHVLGIAKLQS